MALLKLPQFVEDLANQIRWSEAYSAACQNAKREPGTFLSLPAAEWFSGLPVNWTSLREKVCRKTFQSMFPHAASKER